MNRIFIDTIKKSLALLFVAMAFGACAHSRTAGTSDTADRDTVVAAEEQPAEPKVLKVSVLGDSYSTFEGWMPSEENLVWYMPVPKEGRSTDVTKVDQTWWKIFVDENEGYELDVNNSYSGATVCNTGYSRDDYTDRSFITRMDNIGNPDLILVFGATNDDWAKVPLGNYVYSDWTKKQLYSFRPAMAYMLAGMQEKYPGARIVFLINDILRPEIVESITTVCDKYGVEYLQLHDISKMSVHPDAVGMRSIATQLEEFLSRGESKAAA